MGWYADACLLQLARFDRYDGGVSGWAERACYGKRLLSGDDTVLTVIYGSRQHYTFCLRGLRCGCEYLLAARRRCGVEIWQSRGWVKWRRLVNVGQVFRKENCNQLKLLFQVPMLVVVAAVGPR